MVQGKVSFCGFACTSNSRGYQSAFRVYEKSKVADFATSFKQNIIEDANMNKDSFKRFQQVSKELHAYTISNASVLVLIFSNVATAACYQDTKPIMCSGDKVGRMNRVDTITIIGLWGYKKYIYIADLYQCLDFLQQNFWTVVVCWHTSDRLLQGPNLLRKLFYTTCKRLPALQHSPFSNASPRHLQQFRSRKGKNLTSTE